MNAGRPPALSKERRQQVLALRKLGYSQKKIARIIKMSTETVYYVLNGRWRYEPEAERQGLRFPALNALPIRCPTCGAKVHPPCLACQLAQRKRRLGES